MEGFSSPFRYQRTLVLGGLLISFGFCAAEASFVENQGQMDGPVRFYSEHSGVSFYFTPDEIVVRAESESEPGLAQGERLGSVIRISVPEGSPARRLQGRSETPTRFHYLRSHDPLAWRTDVPVYDQVVYQDLWPGSDLRFWFDEGKLHYRLEGEPSSHPLFFECSGGEAIHVDREVQVFGNEVGTLTIRSRTDSQAPAEGVVAWSFATDSPNVDTEAGRNDPSQLIWSTFLGGSGFDGETVSLNATSTGDLILVGSTESSDFPVTAGVYDATADGSADAWIAKLDATGSTLMWCTFLGGSDADYTDGQAVALDSQDQPVVMGRTYSGDFPITPGAFDASYSWGDYFVAKLTATGDALIWSTYLGEQASAGFAVALDAADNPVVVGRAVAGFPTTPGAYDETHNGGFGDAFVAKLQPDGTALQWSSVLGGAGNEEGIRLELTTADEPVVMGTTESSNFPTTNGAHDGTANGGRDVYLAKFSSDGSNLIWSTYLGGSTDEGAFALDLDAQNNPVVGGYTYSTDFPLSAGAIDNVLASQEGFLTKVAADGSSLLWSTFIGGSQDDVVWSIANDSSNNTCVAGTTYSADFPATANGYDSTFNGSADGFFLCLSADGTQNLLASFLGTGTVDVADEILVTSNDDLVLAGATSGSAFPTTSGSYDPTFNGGLADFFVSRFRQPGSTSSSPGVEAGFDRTELEVWPNPFSNQSTVRFELSSPQPARLQLYDAAGRQLWSRDLGDLGAGPHEVPLVDEDWDHLARGSYFLQLEGVEHRTPVRVFLIR